MNKEEKKTVECLKKQYKQSAEKKDATLTIYLVKAKRILELIEKQQKEIKELKERIKEALEEIDTGEYTAYTFYGDILFEDNDLVKILKGE